MADRDPTTAELARERARAAVLAAVGLHGPIARNAIARELGVSPATVTSVTKELLALGLVETVGKAPSNGGRPAELLELVAGSAHMVGAKVTSQQVIGLVADLGGHLVASFEEPFDARGARPVEALEEILRRHLGDGPGTLLGVGLGVPGMVDSQAGGRVTAPTLGWEDVAVGAGLQGRLDVPVLVENDVHTLVVAEAIFGRGRDTDDFVTVTVGRGIGFGIVVGGELHRGAHGGAAELGHNQVVEGGPVCGCGRRGCLEAVASEPALVGRALAEGLLPDGAGIAELRIRAAEGDARAAALFAEAGTHLGRATAAAVNLLAPELVLVSGEGTASWPLLEASFRAAFEQQLLAFHRGVEVVVDPWDDLNWARGAVSLLTRSLFAPSSADGVAERLVRARLASAPLLERSSHGR